jgi:AraC-like DNA-binding protein
MEYQEVKVTGFLSHFAKYFYRYEHHDDDIIHTILPDTCFDLIADFEHGILKDVMLTGIWTKPIDVTVTKGSTLLAIRFKLLAAEYLFQREIKSILNTAISLPLNFWGVDSFASTDFEEFTEQLSGKMRLSLESQKDIDSRKVKLFELISQDGTYTVNQLSEKLAWSSRQINRYFDQQFGFPLKTFLSMARCNASYASIAKGNLFPTKDYFDQPHFVKEVKKYTGTTPRELSKNKNDRFLQLSTIKKE